MFNFSIYIVFYRGHRLSTFLNSRFIQIAFSISRTLSLVRIVPDVTFWINEFEIPPMSYYVWQTWQIGCLYHTSDSKKPINTSIKGQVRLPEDQAFLANFNQYQCLDAFLSFHFQVLTHSKVWKMIRLRPMGTLPLPTVQNHQTTFRERDISYLNRLDH